MLTWSQHNKFGVLIAHLKFMYCLGINLSSYDLASSILIRIQKGSCLVLGSLLNGVIFSRGSRYVSMLTGPVNIWWNDLTVYGLACLRNNQPKGSVTLYDFCKYGWPSDELWWKTVTITRNIFALNVVDKYYFIFYQIKSYSTTRAIDQHNSRLQLRVYHQKFSFEHLSLVQATFKPL
jgi:hypothetical protein